MLLTKLGSCLGEGNAGKCEKRLGLLRINSRTKRHEKPGKDLTVACPDIRKNVGKINTV
jgi:hypothetical protein